MLTRRSLVRKCLLKSKTEVYIHTTESDPIKKPDPEMKGVEQLWVKWLGNILAPSGALVIVTINDPKILKYLAWYKGPFQTLS